MPNVLHFMNAGAQIPVSLAGEVREVAQASLKRHAALLELDGVDVALHVSPWSLAETGVGGYAPLSYFIQITVDPANANFARCWRTELPATIAHELHHARRWCGPGYGHTLLETLVSEGLAQHYEAQDRGEAPIYARLSADLPSLWATAQAELGAASYDHARWFYGAAELPRWAGYTLGFELVRRFLNDEGGNALIHAEVPAQRVRAAWPRG